MSMEEHKAKIRGFLSRFLRTHTLQDEEDIFALGSVNSLFAMQLVMFIEKEFEITVENEDLEIENFRTIQDIGRFIERKMSQWQTVETSSAR